MTPFSCPHSSQRTPLGYEVRLENSPWPQAGALSWLRCHLPEWNDESDEEWGEIQGVIRNYKKYWRMIRNDKDSEEYWRTMSDEYYWWMTSRLWSFVSFLQISWDRIPWWIFVQFTELKHFFCLHKNILTLSHVREYTYTWLLSKYSINCFYFLY